jgi:hypothetical protein
MKDGKFLLGFYFFQILFAYSHDKLMTEKLIFFFLSSLRFTAKLSRLQRFPLHPSPTQAQPPPFVTIPHQRGPFVTVDEPS